MGKTVTRAMLSDRAEAGASLSRHEVIALGQRMFELIGEALMAGESVKLTGFGSLQVRTRAERTGRNPRTGAEHRIAPHSAVVFIPSAKLRDALETLRASAAAQK